MNISVILCTHNPAPKPLRRTLEALRGQSFATDRWEMLLIDNASEPPLADAEGLRGFDNARLIPEPELGLTPARLRGIRESTGELLVFVDDDNVLAPDYLEQAWIVHRERPYIGAYGGSIAPVFQEPPPEWTRPYWYLLAIREAPVDRWGLLPGNAEIEPCGAGLCVRREVAEFYRKTVEQDPLRASLDRRGQSLASAGDMDLIACALDLDLAIGRFHKLKLDHLIPPGRLRPDYLLRLYEEMYYSGELLKWVRRRAQKPGNRNFRRCLHRWIRRCFMASFDRKMQDAAERGCRRAWKQIDEHSA